MVNIDYDRLEVAKTSDIIDQSVKLDEAVATDIFFGSAQNPVKADAFKGVYNMGTGKLISVPSKGYTIIQHRDILQAVGETLEGLNLSCFGRINNLHDKFTMDIAFDDKVLQDDAQGINIGIRVVNSYNKQSSFRLEMWGFRRICMNGMSFGKKMGVSEITMHFGDKAKNLEAVKRITRNFFTRMVDSSDILQNYVNRMIGDSMDYKLMVRVCQYLLDSEKHSKAVIAKLEGAKTRWELYNAMTNYASHGMLSHAVKTKIERLSQQVMYKSVDRLAEMCPEIEA